MAKLQSGTQVFGNLIVNSNIQLGGGVYTTTGLFWAANNNVISTGGGGSSAVGVTGQLQYNNGGILGAASLLYYSGNSSLVANGGVSSTSTTSGSFQVMGGVGVSGAIYAGSIQNTPVGSSTASTGAFTTVTSSGTIIASGNIVAASGTASTSTTTGALVVQGGMGISGNIYAAGGLNSSAGLYATGVYNGGYTGDGVVIDHSNSFATPGARFSAGTGDGYAFYNGGVGTTELFKIDGTTTNVVVASTTTSTSATTGAFVVKGGVGIAGSAFIGSALNLTNTTAATVTSVLTHASDVNFQLTAQNGVTNNTTGSETARFGVNYAGVGWDSYLSFVRGSSSQNGSITIYASNAIAANISSTSTVFAGNITSQWHLPSANVTYNLGSTTAWWNNVYGKASQALYADLAEKYLADDNYEPGTVVVFGGESEITTTTLSHDTRVAGVISTDPAYLMNGALTDGLPVAFTGRVPCFVRGPITKGAILVSSDIPGVAQKLDNSQFSPGCVIGKSLSTILTDEVRLIEVVVGRF